MVNPESIEQVLLRGALKYRSAEARASYLDGACGNDYVLRQRVDALLQAYPESHAPPASGPERTKPVGEMPPLPEVTVPATEKPGDQIGRYRLLQEIGEGGFGTVYLAEQQEPVKRRVALKIIKLGMDTKEVVARFEAERQALALMNHPSIAKVLDGGATESGRPYFVMELVKGVRITEYCNTHKFSTEQRLELFIQVCQAVQHAHQKGIIHRDIKPSNVLVSVQEGEPVPKVIDFGIAKAVDRPLTEKTVVTAFEQFMGTPAYVSPEQAEMSALDIDTRSDIYSLGVLLYELLTDRTPFDVRQLLDAGLDEMRRVIREEDPLRPSTRLTTLTREELGEVARYHRSDPGRFRALLRGDLDWIVMKALEKDRTRRYATANAFSKDIERHLHNEPVEAVAPSAVYRFKKFARRNKAAMTVGVLLVAGVIVSTWLGLRAEWARREAERNRQEAEGRIAFMLDNLLEKMEPLARVDLIDAVVNDAQRYFERQHSSHDTSESLYIRSLALENIGKAGFYQLQYDTAESNYLSALSLRKELLRQEPAVPRWERGIARVSRDLAVLYYRTGQHPDGMRHCEQGLQALTNVLHSADALPDDQYLLGTLWIVHGRLRGLATEDELKALEIFQRLSGMAPSNAKWRFGLAHCLYRVGKAYQENGRPDLAPPRFLEAIEIMTPLVKKASQNHSWRNRLAWCHCALAWVYFGLDQLPEVEHHLKQAMDIFTELSRQQFSAVHGDESGVGSAYLLLARLYGLRHPDDPLGVLLYARTAWEVDFDLAKRCPKDVRWRGGEQGTYTELVSAFKKALRSLEGPTEGELSRKLKSEYITVMAQHATFTHESQADSLFELWFPSEIHLFSEPADGADPWALKGYPVVPGHDVAAPNRWTPLIQTNARWRYSQERAPGDWAHPTFQDQHWSEGQAVLGFGWRRGVVDTDLDPGETPRPITAYFRSAFAVEQPDRFKMLRLGLLVDDGAVVYLNGAEVARFGFDSGLPTIGPETTARSHEATDYQHCVVDLPEGVLRGTNVLAVEVHQVGPESSDMVLGLQLDAAEEATRRQMRSLLSNAELAALYFWDRVSSIENVPWPVRVSMALPDSIRSLEKANLVPAGSEWEYLDQGADPGPDWRRPVVNIRGWMKGHAPLGYARDPDLVTTTVSFGSDPTNKHITTYFRKSFTVPNPGQQGYLFLNLRFDDGAVVYLNGKEICRENMPATEIDHETKAIRGDLPDKALNLLVKVPEPLYRTNILAVEVHQYSPTSSDIFFDLELDYLPSLEGVWKSADGGEAGLRKFLAQAGVPMPEELSAYASQTTNTSQIELPPFPFTADLEARPRGEKSL